MISTAALVQPQRPPRVAELRPRPAARRRGGPRRAPTGSASARAMPRRSGSTRATGVCCSMNSLTSTPHGVDARPAPRQVAGVRRYQSGHEGGQVHGESVPAAPTSAGGIRPVSSTRSNRVRYDWVNVGAGSEPLPRRRVLAAAMGRAGDGRDRRRGWPPRSADRTPAERDAHAHAGVRLRSTRTGQPTGRGARRPGATPPPADPGRPSRRPGPAARHRRPDRRHRTGRARPVPWRPTAPAATGQSDPLTAAAVPRRARPRRRTPSGCNPTTPRARRRARTRLRSRCRPPARSRARGMT